MNRFDERVVFFEESDGLLLELVAAGAEETSAWEDGPVLPTENAIRGFFDATLR